MNISTRHIYLGNQGNPNFEDGRFGYLIIEKEYFFKLVIREVFANFIPLKGGYSELEEAYIYYGYSDLFTSLKEEEIIPIYLIEFEEVLVNKEGKERDIVNIIEQDLTLSTELKFKSFSKIENPPAILML